MARRRCGRSRGLQWVSIATIAAAVLCSRALDPDALKLNTGPRQVHPNLSFCTTNVSYTEYPEAAEAVIPQTLTGAVALEELMAPVRIQSNPQLAEAFRNLMHIGAAEFVNQEVDGDPDYSAFTAVVGGEPRDPRLRRRAEGWAAMVNKNEELSKRFASGRLLPLIPNLVHARGETARSSGLRLSERDRLALDGVFGTVVGGARRVLGKSYCASKLVTCKTINGELRVVGLSLLLMTPDEDTVNTADAERSATVDRDTAFDPTLLEPYNIRALPSEEVAELSHLRMLKFSPYKLLIGHVSGDDACAFLRNLELDILVLVMPLPPSCKLPTVKSLTFLGSAAVDNAAKISAEAGIPDLFTLADRPLESAGLEFICNCLQLQQLEIHRAVAIPACMEQNVQLLRVDLRGAQLQSPLPVQLSKWSNLVDFIAFEQSSRWCVPENENEETASDQSVSIRRGCKVNYHAKAGAMHREGEHQPLWHCSRSGWVVKFDDPRNPWWEWKKLERFWVDVNYLYGGIPADLPIHWPQLRTLDLYSNELTGEVPGSLCSLTQLKTLQLQDNRLSGVFPFDAFFKSCPKHPDGPLGTSSVSTLSLSLNSELKGCVDVAALKEHGVYLADLYLNYTKIRVSDVCATPESTRDLDAL
eukprot:m.461292 g.461292  ORF g.461292 m.461292 type:complete len:643 (-) comp22263_c0_seq1:145-2073(-)